MDSINIAGILRTLLTEHNRVSIPGMGSFIARYCPAAPSNNREELLPPFKEVTFNSKEIWNDERLERMLANESGCSLAKAQEQVAFWVDNLCFRLATKKSVCIDNLGTFSISESNQISFVLDKGLNLLKDAYGLTAVAFKRVPIIVTPTTNIPPKKKSYTWLIFLILLIGAAIALVTFYKNG